MKKKIESLDNHEDAQAGKLYEQATEMHKGFLQELITKALSDGYDIPEKLKDQLKNSPIGK